MTLFLDEDMVGSDRTELAYPRLILCMGVTCVLGNGTLVGTHINGTHTEKALLAKLAEEVQRIGGGCQLMIMAGNFDEHFNSGMLLPHEKAREMGFIGKIHAYDTGKLSPGPDGSFVRVVSGGGSNIASIDVYAMKEGNQYTTASGSTKPQGLLRYSPNRGWNAPMVWKSDTQQTGTKVDTKEFHVVGVH